MKLEIKGSCIILLKKDVKVILENKYHFEYYDKIILENSFFITNNDFIATIKLDKDSELIIDKYSWKNIDNKIISNYNFYFFDIYDKNLNSIYKVNSFCNKDIITRRNVNKQLIYITIII